MLANPERIGLRVIQGLPPSLYARVMGHHILTIARDVDSRGGVAAVWLAFGARGRKPSTHTCLYELGTHGWELAGGGSEPVDMGFLSGRPSAVSAGPVSFLVGKASYDSRSNLANGSARSGREAAVVSWVSCEAFRVATEIVDVRVGERRLKVPSHGYFIVAWVCPGGYPPSQRPRIVGLDSTGDVLTELLPDEYVDSATMAHVERYLEP